VEGFLGLLIDFIECPSQFLPCLDIAAKSKLFSIVCSDMPTAKRILELNDSVKGGVINLYPLSNAQEAKLKKLPEMKDAVPLLDKIKLKEGTDPRLYGTFYNLFSKVYLVKDYTTAMTLASSHGVTAITPDYQIVYAGAFVTKVGQFNLNFDRLTIYQRSATLLQEYEQKQAQYSALEAQKGELDRKDLELLREIQKQEIALSKARVWLQNNQKTFYEIQGHMQQKEKQIKEVERVLRQCEFSE